MPEPEKTLPQEMGFATDESEDSGQNYVLELIKAGNGRSSVLRKIMKNLEYSHDQRAYLCYYYGAVEVMAAMEHARDDMEAREKIMSAGRPKILSMS